MPGWNFVLFPERASTHAARVDALYFFLVAVCTTMAVLISLMIDFFAVKYRRNKLRPAQQVETVAVPPEPAAHCQVVPAAGWTSVAVAQRAARVSSRIQPGATRE